LRAFKRFIAVTLLVLLVNFAPAVSYKLLMRFVPRNLLATFENPVIWFALLLSVDVAIILSVLISSAIGAIAWLVLMKLVFSRSEMDGFLGLGVGRDTRWKRLIKLIVDFVY